MAKLDPVKRNFVPVDKPLNPKQVSTCDRPDSDRLIKPGENLRLVLNSGFIRYLQAVLRPEIVLFVRVEIRNPTEIENALVWEALHINSEQADAHFKLNKDNFIARAGMPLFPAIRYDGQDVIVSLRIIELDQADNKRFKSLIDSAANVGKVFAPVQAGTISLVQAVFGMIASSNEDDVEFQFDFAISRNSRAVCLKDQNGEKRPVTNLLEPRVASYLVLKTENAKRANIPSNWITIGHSAVRYAIGETLRFATLGLFNWGGEEHHDVYRTIVNRPFTIANDSWTLPHWRAPKSAEQAKYLVDNGDELMLEGNAVVTKSKSGDTLTWSPYAAKSYLMVSVDSPAEGIDLSTKLKEFAATGVVEQEIRTTQLDAEEFGRGMKQIEERAAEAILMSRLEKTRREIARASTDAQRKAAEEAFARELQRAKEATNSEASTAAIENVRRRFNSDVDRARRQRGILPYEFVPPLIFDGANAARYRVTMSRPSTLRPRLGVLSMDNKRPTLENQLDAIDTANRTSTFEVVVPGGAVTSVLTRFELVLTDETNTVHREPIWLVPTLRAGSFEVKEKADRDELELVLKPADGDVFSATLDGRHHPFVNEIVLSLSSGSRLLNVPPDSVKPSEIRVKIDRKTSSMIESLVIRRSSGGVQSHVFGSGGQTLRAPREASGITVFKDHEGKVFAWIVGDEHSDGPLQYELKDILPPKSKLGAPVAKLKAIHGEVVKVRPSRKADEKLDFEGVARWKNKPAVLSELNHALIHAGEVLHNYKGLFNYLEVQDKEKRKTETKIGLEGVAIRRAGKEATIAVLFEGRAGKGVTNPRDPAIVLHNAAETPTREDVAVLDISALNDDKQRLIRASDVVWRNKGNNKWNLLVLLAYGTRAGEKDIWEGHCLQEYSGTAGKSGVLEPVGKAHKFKTLGDDGKPKIHNWEGLAWTSADENALVLVSDDGEIDTMHVLHLFMPSPK